MQFNPLRPQILATAGANGELFIYDVNDPESAFRLGTAAARSDDLECVAWNIKVAHILATGGSGGFVTVWDLKTKKASLTLNNNRKAVSSIAWDPNNSTKLLTATPDDSAPVILLWDLRNSNAPERTLQGHEQGVLSVSWCLHDPELLISSGKDNRTLIWNPATGERYGEFPEVTNWTFLTRFNPHNPSISATASFDGKITVQTLQNTNPSATQNIVQNSLDGEDFFTQAQTQPQGAAFSLPKAPRWLERPVGASFGFGGKLIVFKAVTSQPGQKRSSTVQIARYTVDSDIGSATEKFEESLSSGNVAAICESRKEEAETEEEKADWQVMETLLAENPRKKIVECLGVTDAANGVSDDEEEDEEEAEKPPPAPKAKLDVKGHKKRISTFFSSDGAEVDGEDFLASLSATKGAKTDNPFSLFDDSDSASEKRITQALTLGNFAKAVDVCLKEKRMADAFMIANCGGKELVDKVQAAYLTQKTGMPSYLRLLSSVIVKNLWDVVYNADLSAWKHTMVTLCTFADPAEFPDLCEALGDRILESGDRKDASFCFLVGSKLEKVVNIWISDLQEAEKAAIDDGDDTVFSIHARTLQQFIEKVSIFRHVTKFQDGEIGLASDWKLASLYDKYVEYADIVAAHGQLEVAQKYLNLLPSQYPAAALARERVNLATKKPATTAAARQPTAATRATARTQPNVGYQAQQTIPQPPASITPSPYAPPTQTPAQAPYGGPTPVASNPYAPPGTTLAYQQSAPNPYAPPSNNPYAPQSGYQTPQPGPQFNTPAQAYGPPPTALGGPPRSGTPSSRPPPAKLSEVGNWNDVPVVSRPPPRKNTPSMAPVTSPFNGQPGIMSPPPPQGHFGQGPANTPPPPRGSAPPRAGSPSTGPQFGGALPPPPRTGSSLANTYAPPPNMQQGPVPGSGLPPPPPMGGAVPRTASPYTQPPNAGPPTSRYAPAPSAQPSSMPPQQNFAPPPSQGFSAPPQAGPPPRAAGHSPAPPPPQAAAPPRAAAPPQKPRHPAGDRSHIPPNAISLVDVLNQDMQRVAAKAPASFAPQVKDTQKRLGLLFDHLNNEELVKPDTIEQLTQLANALETQNYPEAQRLQVEIQRDKTEECGNWMVGVKRLVQMSKVTN